jgi:hypothetical protein
VMTPEEIIAHLETRGLEPKACGRGRRQARCPVHEDRKPSLSISEGGEGRTLLHCHAGCEMDDVLAGVGLDKTDLFITPIPWLSRGWRRRRRIHGRGGS